MRINSADVRRVAFFGLSCLLLSCAAQSIDDIEADDLEFDDVEPYVGELISDQTHAGGKVGFFFLPPIVPTLPRTSGAFEARLSPEVRIDQIDASGNVVKNIATYTGSVQVFGERLRRNLRTQFYVVRFKSNGLNLNPALTYRIKVSAGGLQLGIADIDVVNTLREALNVNRNSFVPLVKNAVLAIRFRIEKKAVDKDGDGVFDWLDNCPNVPNPPVALPADVPAVTARAPSSCNPELAGCDPQEQDLNPIASVKQPDSDGDGIGDACDTQCTPIANCTSPVTCTAASDSQCTACATGFRKVDGTVDTCAACTPVAHCTAALRCTSPTNSQCSSCEPGFGADNSLDATQCLACSPIAGCVSPVTCSLPTESQCTQCAPGRFLNNNAGNADTCDLCAPIDGCTGTVTCTTAANSVCGQ